MLRKAWRSKSIIGVWEQALEKIHRYGLEAMIFAGNRGLVQIQTGKVHNIVRAKGYLNILDNREEGFSLHLKDNEIAETWIVRRCIREGLLTCIESFDQHRKTVVQLFGRRQERQGEPALWQQITDELAAIHR